MVKAEKINMIDGSTAILLDNEKIKQLSHPEYNFIFNKKTGFFIRWGKTTEDDGNLNLGIPEILDLEISEKCLGVPGSGVCQFCYKSNTPHGKTMSLETFKKIFEKLPKTIGQIAFGCGTLRKHPEMWGIFKYSKANGVTPNLTINGDVDEHEFDKIAEYAGACACSIYDKELSYNAIKKLTDRGMTQVNIHFMISEQTYDRAFEIMNDIKTDIRLKKLNAIVFLSLKPKGRAIKNNFTQLSQEKFTTLVNYALDNKIPFGFDSCSAQKFMKSIPANSPMNTYAEPCESSIFSAYIDVNGDFYPCSFAEGTEGWKQGISVINCQDFLKEVWWNEKTLKFKEKVINCRDCKIGCSIYDV